MQYDTQYKSGEVQIKSPFSKVLVSIDGSDHSVKAVEYAIDIARDNMYNYSM
jgi:hypothetical protein